MADDSKITLDQFKRLLQRADERLDKLELGKAAKVTTVTVSIPAAAWTANTDADAAAAGFAYYADVAVGGLKETDCADTVLGIASLDAAKKAGMSNTATMLAGKIRYYAVKKPTQALTAQVRILQGVTTNGEG